MARRAAAAVASLNRLAGKVEKGKAPTLFRKRLEIGLDENLDGLVAGVNLDTNRFVAKVNLVASSIHCSNDGVGHDGLLVSDRRGDDGEWYEARREQDRQAQSN